MVYHAEWNVPIEHTNRFVNTNITFIREDGAPGMKGDMKTLLVVTPTTNNAKVGCILVDGRSSLNLLLASVLDQMEDPKVEDHCNSFLRHCSWKLNYTHWACCTTHNVKYPGQ